jgi:hypothetical protein
MDTTVQDLTACRGELASLAIFMQERGLLPDSGGDNYALVAGAVITHVLTLEGRGMTVRDDAARIPDQRRDVHACHDSHLRAADAKIVLCDRAFGHEGAHMYRGGPSVLTWDAGDSVLTWDAGDNSTEEPSGEPLSDDVVARYAEFGFGWHGYTDDANAQALAKEVQEARDTAGLLDETAAALASSMSDVVSMRQRLDVAAEDADQLAAVLDRYEHVIRDHCSEFALGDVAGALAAHEYAVARRQ